MALTHDPVALGSVQSRSVETGIAIVSEVRFPAGSVVPAHTHARTIVGVMLDGAFESAIAGRRLSCRVDTAWIEPRGERHANDIGRSGARVLAIQPNHDRDDLFAPLAPMLEDVRLIETAGLRADARRLSRELGSADPFSALTIDSLVVLMLSSAARLSTRERFHSGPPRWLLRARDALRAQFAQPPRLDELGRIAGVSVSHLTHSFRKHFHTTPGEYVRHVRLHWAADELAATDRPLSEIAHAAGYCDQSHFTRELRRAFGVAPGEYRARSEGVKPQKRN
jgi:AraC family transcriptional regulator